jgi:twinkle protein
LASLELRPEIFLGRLAKQASAMSTPSNEFIQAVMEWFSGKLWYIDVLGKIDLKRLIEVFHYGLRRYGIDVFIIDSFMMLNGVYEDDFKSQKMCIEEICQFKNQHYCQVHMIVHPRKGADESAMPTKLDAKGSGSITDAADNCFSVWRNKAKEGVIQKKNQNQPISDKESAMLEMPDSLWRCDKQRNGLWEGVMGLWYDKNTFQYLDWENKQSKRYVQYSCIK